MLDFIPKRYVFSLLGLSATTLAIALQTNLSMAIVYMVQRTSQNSSLKIAPRECAISQDFNGNITQPMQVSGGHLDWSSEVQGVAIGAQFLGIMIGCVPGGRLAEVYGGKVTMISTIFVSSVVTAFLPLAAYVSIYAFIVCRILVGLGTAPVFPVLVYMLSQWIPTSEQSFTSSFILAGYGTGTFISYITSGFLCSSEFLDGWPAVFYLSALGGLIWSIWSIFVFYDSPEKHPSISKKELEYIKKNRAPEMKKLKSIPWKSLVISIPLWALAIGAFGQFWIMAFFATSLALYMGTILNLDSEENGEVSCLPNLLRAVFACVIGILIDFVLRRRKIPIVYIRKGATLINSIAACLGFIGVLFAGCNVTLTALCFVIAAALNDFTIFGVCLAPVDMAPNLSGTLSGILNFFICAPYILLSILIGEVTQQERSFKQWSYIYYCSIGVTIVTTVIYLVYGSSDIQPWAKDQSQTEFPEESNKNYRVNNTVDSSNGHVREVLHL